MNRLSELFAGALVATVVTCPSAEADSLSLSGAGTEFPIVTKAMLSEHDIEKEASFILAFKQGQRDVETPRENPLHFTAGSADFSFKGDGLNINVPLEGGVVFGINAREHKGNFALEFPLNN